jgi:hypothetical protein
MQHVLEPIARLVAVTVAGWGASVSVGTPWWAWLAVMVMAGGTWFGVKPRAYGLMLLCLPGSLALVVTPGGAIVRAIAAGIAMLGYWAAWASLQSQDEESRFGWWPSVLLWAWLPTAPGVLGLGFLAASSSRRWRAGLSPARGAQSVTHALRWGLVGAGLTLVTLVAWVIPQPGGFRLDGVPLVIPRLEIPTPSSQPPPPMVDGQPRSPLNFGWGIPAWVWLALAVVCVFWFGQRAPGTIRAYRAGKIRKRRVLWDLGLPLAIGTAFLMAYVLVVTAVSGAVPMNLEISSVWLQVVSWLYVLLLVLALWRAWLWLRALLDRYGLKPLEPIALPGRTRMELELPADRVRAAYARWLAHLRDLELERGPWETPSELCGRVHVHHPAMRQATNVLTASYERVRYGAAPSVLEARTVEDALTEWLEVKPVPNDSDHDSDQDIRPTPRLA